MASIYFFSSPPMQLIRIIHYADDGKVLLYIQRQLCDACVSVEVRGHMDLPHSVSAENTGWISIGDCDRCLDQTSRRCRASVPPTSTPQARD